MGDATPLLSSLPERLRGIYRPGVNDGAGPLNGSMEFTRQFETPPIQHAAADRIEQLEAHLAKMAEAVLKVVEVSNSGSDTIAFLVELHSVAKTCTKALRDYEDLLAAVDQQGGEHE